ncbi:unnamed protein product [Microthlaspi erraticum]|uniref:Uncharacterized protein n=1 Tax=Microthlaspi erraticum TaxID=1685480 RepID=A0A6D2JPW5_9BRAS|nr:unnamed protein product [Microthlaspi erraticum]
MFMEKFKQADRDVGDIPDNVPLEALRNGLWYDTKFKEDLSLRPPATLEDTFHRSQSNIFFEEDKRFYAEKHGDRRTLPSRPNEDATHSAAFMGGTATQLKTVSISSITLCACTIWEKSHRWKVIDLGGKVSLRDQPSRDNKKSGRDRSILRKTKGNLMRHQKNRDDLPPPPKRQVSMIMGGLLDSNDSISAIKEYERKAVILVDTGSTVNLIFKETLDRMGVEENSIKPASCSLTCFTAEHVFHCGISKIVKFIVMDKPGIYNAIFGTPWLHNMKAVISTFHQCVKFPTPSGIFTLRGNERVTR